MTITNIPARSEGRFHVIRQEDNRGNETRALESNRPLNKEEFDLALNGYLNPNRYAISSFFNSEWRASRRLVHEADICIPECRSVNWDVEVDLFNLGYEGPMPSSMLLPKLHTRVWDHIDHQTVVRILASDNNPEVKKRAINLLVEEATYKANQEHEMAEQNIDNKARKLILNLTD